MRERRLERARHAHDLDVAGHDTVLQKRADGRVEQAIDDEVVEPRRDDAEAQAARVEVAFERLDAIIHASLRSAASETYSTTSSPKPDSACMLLRSSDDAHAAHAERAHDLRADAERAEIHAALPPPADLRLRLGGCVSDCTERMRSRADSSGRKMTATP